MSSILQTEHLLLRPPQAGDIRLIVSLLGDYEVSRNLSTVPHPYTEDDARAYIVSQADARARGEGYGFTILRKSDGALIGICGVHPARAFEIGYWVGKPYWRCGFATEAVGAVVAFAFQVLDADSVRASVIEDNLASGRVLEKLGFVPCGNEERLNLSRGHNVFCHKVILTRAKFEQALNQQ